MSWTVSQKPKNVISEDSHTTYNEPTYGHAYSDIAPSVASLRTSLPSDSVRREELSEFEGDLCRRKQESPNEDEYVAIDCESNAVSNDSHYTRLALTKLLTSFKNKAGYEATVD